MILFYLYIVKDKFYRRYELKMWRMNSLLVIGGIVGRDLLLFWVVIILGN